MQDCNLGNMVSFLYPNAIPVIDYGVMSTPRGYEIVYWNEEKLGAQPTEEFLLTKTQEGIDLDVASVVIIKALKAKPRVDWTEKDYEDAVFSLVQLFR